METYGYAVIQQRATAIELTCTDPLFISQLLDALFESIGAFGVSACKVPTEELYRYRLFGINEDLERVWQLIVQRFCRHGWDPFEDSSTSCEEPYRVLGFRFQGYELEGEAAPES